MKQLLRLLGLIKPEAKKETPEEKVGGANVCSTCGNKAEIPKGHRQCYSCWDTDCPR